MKAAKKLHENQARVEQLTKDWTEKWKEAKSIMQVGGVGWALSISEIPLVNLALSWFLSQSHDACFLRFYFCWLCVFSLLFRVGKLCFIW